EDFLPATGPERRALLVELVHTDLYYRIKAYEPIQVADYLARYPELGEDPQWVRELISVEQKMHQDHEPNATGEYLHPAQENAEEEQRDSNLTGIKGDSATTPKLQP